MTIRDDSAKVFVDAPFWRAGLDFSTNKVFTTLIDGVSVNSLDGATLFENPLVPSVIIFAAECVALVPKSESAILAEGDIRRKFDFGFIQGLNEQDIHLEYWGKFAGHGRTILHFTMPNAFEVDTTALTKPWTRIRATRFSVTKINPLDKAFHQFKIKATFSDHPMFAFDHTVDNSGTTSRNLGSVKNFLRSATFQRQFRTIFCFQDLATNKIESISATEWSVKYKHTVTYTEAGGTLSRNVTGPNGKDQLPIGGTPSNIGQIDRDILRMAQGSGPFTDSGVIARRLGDSSLLTKTAEDTNPDFTSDFFK